MRWSPIQRLFPLHRLPLLAPFLALFTRDNLPIPRIQTDDSLSSVGPTRSRPRTARHPLFYGPFFQRAFLANSAATRWSHGRLTGTPGSRRRTNGPCEFLWPTLHRLWKRPCSQHVLSRPDRRRPHLRPGGETVGHLTHLAPKLGPAENGAAGPSFTTRECTSSDGYEVTGGTFERATFGALGEWNHYVAVLDGTKISLYRNGTLADSGNCVYDSLIDVSGQPIVFGARVTSPGPAASISSNISLSDVRVYNRAVSAEEALFLADITSPFDKPF